MGNFRHRKIALREDWRLGNESLTIEKNENTALRSDYFT